MYFVMIYLYGLIANIKLLFISKSAGTDGTYTWYCNCIFAQPNVLCFMVKTIIFCLISKLMSIQHAPELSAPCFLTAGLIQSVIYHFLPTMCQQSLKLIWNFAWLLYMFFSIVLSFVCYGISKAMNSHMPCVMARDASIISHMHLSRKSTVAAHN